MAKKPPDRHKEEGDTRVHDIHDAFFKQTLSDETLAGHFLRELLPEELRRHLHPTAEPIAVENEFVLSGFYKKLADKVMRMPLIGGGALLFVFDHKKEADRLAVGQVCTYCNAVCDKWYRRERRKEKGARRRAPEPAPKTVAVIVHTGSARYGHANELVELAGPAHPDIRRFLASQRVVVVDLRSIADENLSTHPVLRARLLVLKHATDPDLKEPGKLDHLLALAKVEELPPDDAGDILV